MRSLAAFGVLLGSLVALGQGEALGFCTSGAPHVSTVTERYDAGSDRYFIDWSAHATPGGCTFDRITEDPVPGTTKTGLAWTTWTFAYGCPAGSLPGSTACAHSRPLCRFHATSQPQPQSRFFTINQAECESLKRPGSGWTFDPSYVDYLNPGVAPLAAFEVDLSTGQCPAGLLPVYRFYKDGRQERSNGHRWVADEAVRRQMHVRPGWVEEGVAFCVPVASRVALASAGQNAAAGYPTRVDCMNGFGEALTCIEAIGMAAPSTRRGPYNLFPVGGPDQPGAYYDRTGVIAQYAYTYPLETDAQAALHSFALLYQYNPGVAFFVTSLDRSGGTRSAMRSRTPVPVDSPLRPFDATHEVDMDLSIDAQFFVKRVRAAGIGSEAVARPVITFVDDRSGLRLHFVIGSIGTPASADSAGRDPLTGDTLVAVALGPMATVGRNLGLPALTVAANFDSLNGWGYGGDFRYRINRAEFGRVIDRARAIEPALGAEPGDYRIESFGIRGDVIGDAEIGVNSQQFGINVVRP